MDSPLHPRIEDSAYGMMIGLAIGDAMGAPLEFQEGREPENYVKKYLILKLKGSDEENVSSVYKSKKYQI